MTAEAAIWAPADGLLRSPALSRLGLVAGFTTLWTTTPGLLLGVAAADCVPLLLADPASGSIGRPR